MRVKSISLPLSLGTQIFSSQVAIINEKISSTFNLLAVFLKEKRQKLSDSFATSAANVGKPKYILRNNLKKVGKILLIFAVFAVVLLGAKKVVPYLSNKSNDGGKIRIKEARGTQEINKEFTFPLRDQKKEVVSNVKYMIEKVELRDEIVVKGQRATAVKGRAFLIVTLKVSNEYKQPIEMDTRDYARLSVNGNREEWLAPDIHNDPVEVQAISTKYTRIGFPINETDKNLVLRVGEIDGQKEEIPLEFQ